MDGFMSRETFQIRKHPMQKIVAILIMEELLSSLEESRAQMRLN